MAFNDFFRISVHAVFTNAENKILMLKANYGDKHWGLPGGALDPAETIHEALKRECKEELNVDIEIMHMSGMYYHKAYNSQAGIFYCKILPPAIIQLSNEHSEYRYFSLEELSEVQRHRVLDCLNFDGKVKSASF